MVLAIKTIDYPARHQKKRKAKERMRVKREKDVEG